MGDGGGFFRGTSQEQDARFSDKEKKLIRLTKFPPEFDIKVDMKKVKFDVIKPWISQKITALLGFEDEVLIGYIFSLLEEKQNPDPKALQVNITGFLATDASDFMLQLWKLLISAQTNIGGIPAAFLEQKKKEIAARMAEQERLRTQIGKRIEKDTEEADANGTSVKAENGDRKKSDQLDKSKSQESKDREDRKRERSDRDRREDKDRRDRRDDRERRDRRGDRDRRDDKRRSDEDRHHRDSKRDRRDDSDDKEKRDKRHKRDDSSDEDRSPGAERHRKDKKRRHSHEDHSTKEASANMDDLSEEMQKERELREKALASITKKKEEEKEQS